MTKFLADENIPPPVVSFLRSKGFDIKEAARSIAAGASDASVMELARQEERILLAGMCPASPALRAGSRGTI